MVACCQPIQPSAISHSSDSRESKVHFNIWIHVVKCLRQVPRSHSKARKKECRVCCQARCSTEIMQRAGVTAGEDRRSRSRRRNRSSVRDILIDFILSFDLNVHQIIE